MSPELRFISMIKHACLHWMRLCWEQQCIPILARCGLFIGLLWDGPLKAPHNIQRWILQYQQASVLQEVIFVLLEGLADRASLFLSFSVFPSPFFFFFACSFYLFIYFFTLWKFHSGIPLSGLILHTPTFTTQILDGGLLNDPQAGVCLSFCSRSQVPVFIPKSPWQASM